MRTPPCALPPSPALRSLLALSCAWTFACQDKHGHSGSHPAPAPVAAPATREEPPPANAVQTEMRLLEDAMKTTVTAIANTELAPVVPAIHRVHMAKQATEQAIESGAWRPAKGADQLPRFASLDKEFHNGLEALVEAAGRGDVDATARAFGAAMAGCAGCHREFRK